MWALPNLATSSIKWGLICENLECRKDLHNCVVLLPIVDFLNSLCQKTLPRNTTLFQETLDNHRNDRSITVYYLIMGSRSRCPLYQGDGAPQIQPGGGAAVCKDTLAGFVMTSELSPFWYGYPDTDGSMCLKLERATRSLCLTGALCLPMQSSAFRLCYHHRLWDLGHGA